MCCNYTLVLRVHLFLHTDFVEENVIRLVQEMSDVFTRQSCQDEEGEENGDNNHTNESDDDGTNNHHHQETDHWMLLCRLNQHCEQSDDLLLENGTNWFQEARLVPMDLLKE